MEEHEPLSVVLAMSRAFGLAPYDTLQHLHPSRPARIYSCILHIALSIISLYMLTYIDISNGTYSKLPWLVNAALLEITIWISIARGSKTLRDILFVLTQVKKICRLVKYNDTKNEAQRRLRRMFISIAGASFATMLLIIIFGVLNTDAPSMFSGTGQQPGKWFFHLKCIVMLIMTGQFVLVSTKVNCALAAVNCALRQLYTEMCPHGGPEEKEKEHWIIKEYGVSFIHVKPKLVATFDRISGTAEHVRLRSLASAYVSTCELARKLGATAGPMLLLVLVSNILNLIQGIYYLILSTSHLIAINLDSMVFIGTAVVNCILHFARFMFMVSPCHELSEELENTRYLVSHLSCEVSPCSEAFRAELEVFLIHVGCNPPHYSALGVCTIGRPLVLTMAAFHVTYLAVLLGI